MTPFKNGYQITQVFGARPEYYGQWGFAGHEGVDLIPLDSNWDMLCIEDGVVIRDINHPRDAYGNYVLVWNQKNLRGWWYCHLASNSVEHGQEVKRGDKIGVMGNTGNSSGPHLHLGLRYGDENKNPVNTDNGFKGFVDPLPVLKEINMGVKPLKETPIDWYDMEGNMHEVGWYVYEWGVEKKKTYTLAEEISEKKEHIESLQASLADMNVQLSTSSEQLKTCSDSKSALEEKLEVLEGKFNDVSAELEKAGDREKELIEERDEALLEVTDLKKKVKDGLSQYSRWELLVEILRVGR